MYHQVIGMGLISIFVLSPCIGKVDSFSTGGHTVYHLRPATVESGERVVISTTYDGFVLCNRRDGQMLWKTSIDGHFPFDMAVSDIDHDGHDETMVVTAAGKLYTVDDSGEILWVFDKTAPLFQVCTAKLDNGSTVILTGGVEQILYVLSSKGRLLGSIKTKHVIRHLRVGDICGEGHDYAAVATTNRGLSGTLSLLLIDPANRKVEIVLQHLKGTWCVDILSGQALPIENGRIHVTVPMGTLRIVDIEHQ